jgi:drug/metabolite transporter (DMT)-like permease
MGTNLLYRIGGLICLVAAAAFGWFFIWLPLQQAQAHAAEVEYSVKAFVFVPFAAVFGVFFLIFGDSVEYRNVEKQTPTAAGWVLFLIAMVAGGLGFWWFDSQFSALGYHY